MNILGVLSQTILAKVLHQDKGQQMPCGADNIEIIILTKYF